MTITFQADSNWQQKTQKKLIFGFGGFVESSLKPVGKSCWIFWYLQPVAFRSTINSIGERYGS